ncbi:hypothetical protein PQO01_14305 [Lentisphaera marina]|nr:hypothetical protein [Lentisphaera marina]MDD7986120.1 hypothetical protein [Lentisphaera marina]
MKVENMFKNSGFLPTIEDLFPAPQIKEDFVAWPFIDNLFDFTKLIGKKT